MGGITVPFNGGAKSIAVATCFGIADLGEKELARTTTSGLVRVGVCGLAVRGGLPDVLDCFPALFDDAGVLERVIVVVL